MRYSTEQRAALQAMEADGKLTAEQVVEAAKDPAHILHDLFEWNDKIAADAHRLDRAREIIREVRLTVITRKMTIEVPRYVPDPDRNRRSGYLSMETLRDDDDAGRKREVIIQEANRALGVMLRAQGIADALGMGDVAARIIGEWRLWRDAVEQGDEPEALPLAAD